MNARKVRQKTERTQGSKCQDIETVVASAAFVVLRTLRALRWMKS